MRYFSVCSGIEACSVAWEPLGWEPVGFCEIDPFPKAVLAHRFPEVNDYGDFTEIIDHDVISDLIPGEIDLIVGGTPCQSFSNAGKRAGLDDPRGILTLEFGRLIGRVLPKYVLWENVPGFLSIDKGETAKVWMDILQGMGYVIDIDLLDAQFFGLSQRRERVFIICKHRDAILREKTDSSALIMAQCLSEISLLLLGALQGRFNDGATVSGFVATDCVRGLDKRISLFSLLEEDRLLMSLGNLDAALARLETGRVSSGSNHGESTKTA